mmetsp:Transcript_22881/g.48672  ORF Transcript_22881/g.48672 Transcript_22881/m.48672 type:complete len:342 (-) Transcript_22881:271-1296(-)
MDHGDLLHRSRASVGRLFGGRRIGVEDSKSDSIQRLSRRQFPARCLVHSLAGIHAAERCGNSYGLFRLRHSRLETILVHRKHMPPALLHQAALLRRREHARLRPRVARQPDRGRVFQHRTVRPLVLHNHSRKRVEPTDPPLLVGHGGASGKRQVVGLWWLCRRPAVDDVYKIDAPETRSHRTHPASLVHRSLRPAGIGDGCGGRHRLSLVPRPGRLPATLCAERRRADVGAERLCCLAGLAELARRGARAGLARRQQQQQRRWEREQEEGVLPGLPLWILVVPASRDDPRGDSGGRSGGGRCHEPHVDCQPAPEIFRPQAIGVFTAAGRKHSPDEAFRNGP